MKTHKKRYPMVILTIVLIYCLGLISCAQKKGEQVVVYTAKKIITMDESIPEARAVAVSGGKISAVGSLEEVKQLLGDGNYAVNEQFQNKVLVPGFIDNHLHPLLVGGFVLQMKFITPFDWNLPSGRIEGVRGKEAYLSRLKEIEAGMEDPNEFLWTWGHHPLFHGDVWRADLDKISSTRPIIVWARSFHEVVLNTPALKELGIEDPKHDQVDWMKGWFMEAGYKQHFLFNVAPYLLQPERLTPALKQAREVIHLGGITTAADMAAGALNLDMEWARQQEILENDQTPFRTFYIPVGSEIIASRYGGLEKAAVFYDSLLERNTHRMRWVKQIKLFGDGAFYSQLMQMQDDYLDGHKGEWIMPPDEFERSARIFWNRGWQIHAHINGDLGMKVALDVLEQLLKENPRKDHRFTMHHTGYFTKEQAKRMGELGVAVSAQPYYLHALGDLYSEIGMGPERAHYMVRLKSLNDNGVRVSLHSDFTMAPAEPLRLMWVAVNRFSASGKVLGPEERITVEQALRAVTIDAAYAIQMEEEIGSITPDKIADLTVLEQDPYGVAPEKLKDIPIWGTVFEGKPYPIKK